MGTSNSEKQARFKARQRAAGFDLVAIWIPRESRDLINRIAAMLRETAPHRREKEGKKQEVIKEQDSKCLALPVGGPTDKQDRGLTEEAAPKGAPTPEDA